MLARERLKAPPSPEMIALVFDPWLQESLPDFDHLLRIHLAHTVMLAQQGIIDAPDAARLVGGLLNLTGMGAAGLKLDSNLEDLFYNVEAHLTAELGPGVAGQLHTGRSRNDIQSTIQRMHTRLQVNLVCETALDLRQAILDLAFRHTGTVMPGYTHFKPAQPITFGYYLSAVANALERDTERVENVYGVANHCPLGAAALAGTSFDIDRRLTARLLGFEGLVENCLDGVASRDYALQLLAGLAIMTTTLSRLAEDLYVWQTDEFRLIELDDSICGVSSIMPQKKNPFPLEAIKGRAAQVYGALVAGLAGNKSTTFSNNMETWSAGIQQSGMAVSETCRGLKLAAMAVRNLRPNEERMRDLAASDFSTATDLADLLVRRGGLSFREAHTLIGKVVGRSFEAGLPANRISYETLNQTAIEMLGRSVELNPNELEAALDPRHSVSGRLHEGGTAPLPLGRLLERATSSLAKEMGRLTARVQKLAEAQVLLTAAAHDLLGR